MSCMELRLMKGVLQISKWRFLGSDDLLNQCCWKQSQSSSLGSDTTTLENGSEEEENEC